MNKTLSAFISVLLALAFIACAGSVSVPSDPTAQIARQELDSLWKGEQKIELRIAEKDNLREHDGFEIDASKSKITITSPSSTGLLYGAYYLLRQQAMGKDIQDKITENPAYTLRMLNHWDNLNGTIERGYAGRSLWKWDELPDTVSPRYKEYARICATTGINAAVLNNVNASPKILSGEYIRKVAAIAGELRPYGIKVFLSANFASPMALDSLATADPLDPEVQAWWNKKCDEIYSEIPDFGGFLVKANSEGQPGPCDFGRTHADGANMLARALKKHGGTVLWRAFVYSPSDADRAKQAYQEFEPLDGKFDDNVIIQIKNGPIDFQPREPFSPLFGAMQSTDQAVELQITQEYLGHSNHVAWLAPMWSEFFSQVDPQSLKAVAGVANVGDSPNMTGHPLAMANWYAFGRLAWNPGLRPEEIIDEWLPQALPTDKMPADVVKGLKDMMLGSREAVVDYMMPLGLNHIFAFGHHYGPAPWCEVRGARADWLPKYYHRAATDGIGFERGPEGSNAVEQYPEEFRNLYASAETCPDNLLLWFHHVPWTHRMHSGLTLWDDLCLHYQRGVDKVASMQKAWQAAKPYIDPALFADVAARLDTQAKDARWWKDACLLYFAQFSKMPWPQGVEAPAGSLDQYMKVNLPISNYECPSAELLDSVR